LLASAAARQDGVTTEQKFEADGHFEDAVTWYRDHLSGHGWHVDKSDNITTTFRRDDSAPASLLEANRVRAFWFIEVEQNVVYQDAYTFIVRLRCEV
jgi:hypothetical protein